MYLDKKNLCELLFWGLYRITLFKIISKTGVRPTLLKLLFNMYSQQTMFVRSDKVVSQFFEAGNCVRQGGIVSPILFTLNLDVDILKPSGFGCYDGNVFVSALAYYADDIVLLAPSRFTLFKFLNQCSISLKLYQFDFNAIKSKFIIHSHNHEIYQEEIYFIKKIIQSQLNCRHSGNTVGTKHNEKRVIAATANSNIKTMLTRVNISDLTNLIIIIFSRCMQINTITAFIYIASVFCHISTKHQLPRINNSHSYLYTHV